jgi:hypothetical protein
VYSTEIKWVLVIWQKKVVNLATGHSRMHLLPFKYTKKWAGNGKTTLTLLGAFGIVHSVYTKVTKDKVSSNPPF